MTDPADKSARTRRRLGEYTLIRRLGRGSMGAVFLAHHEGLEKDVALKVLAPRFAKSESYVHRFFREAEAAARLNHPNIISAIAVGEDSGYKFLAMEFVDGPTIGELLSRGGSLDEERAITIVFQMANALDHAHEAGFVHRDIKPANIMLTSDGTAKLLDLGLAKEVGEGGGDTEHGQVLGTPDYISPEQARGDTDIDIRTDLYSLGATFYHMVTGQVPFPGTTPAVVMTKHLTEGVPDPHEVNPVVSREVGAVIRKMMAKERGRRYQSPVELILALTAIREGTAPKPVPVLKSRRGRSRRRRRY